MYFVEILQSFEVYKEIINFIFIAVRRIMTIAKKLHTTYSVAVIMIETLQNFLYFKVLITVLFFSLFYPSSHL